MANTTITKEMMEAVDSYSNRITTIEDFVSAVRQMPGMYIGPIGNQGFVNMFREIYQNSVDGIMDPNSPCNWIEVWYDMNKLEITVEDNGLGLPFGDMVRILTEEHTSKNYEKRKGEYSSGLHGVGAKVVNALSEYFIAESYHYSGEARRLELIQGVQKDKIKEIPNKNHKQGTKITFKPCNSYKGKEIMGEIDVDWTVLYTLAINILSLTPIGSKLNFNVIDKSGKHIQEEFVNKDGIITNLIMKTDSPLIKPIILNNDTGYMKADIAFTWSNNISESEDITAFANLCPTSLSPDNAHVSGFKESLGAWIAKYMNNIYLGEKSKIRVNSKDILSGLKVMISVAHLHPIFTGQAKEVFSNKDIKPFLKDLINNGMDEWAKLNPQDLNKLCKFIKDIADARQKAETEKIKIVNKYTANKTTGLPAKYAAPTGPLNKGEEFELLIVEGDSAAGATKMARDPKRQGVYGIRGKMPNAFNTPLRKLLDNTEVQGIRAILSDGKEDLGIGKNFDVSRCKYKKVIITSDADCDGNHIASLIERLFLILFPGMIVEGRLYKAVPPLFGIPTRNGFKYFTERIDFVKYVQSEFMKSNIICFKDKSKISNTKLSEILAHNEDYLYQLNRISNIYAINPILLEMILRGYYQKISVSKLEKEILKKYRFAKLDFKSKNSFVNIDGLIGKNIVTVICNNKFFNECKHLEDYYTSEAIYPTRFILNNNEIGLYELMNNFDDSGSGLKLSRFKGLGEMESEQLAESTVHPDSDRTLIQYTVKDLSKQIEEIRYYESDKSKLFKYVGKVSRTDLLG